MFKKSLAIVMVSCVVTAAVSGCAAVEAAKKGDWKGAAMAAKDAATSTKEYDDKVNKLLEMKKIDAAEAKKRHEALAKLQKQHEAQKIGMTDFHKMAAKIAATGKAD